MRALATMRLSRNSGIDSSYDELLIELTEIEVAINMLRAKLKALEDYHKQAFLIINNHTNANTKRTTRLSGTR